LYPHGKLFNSWSFLTLKDGQFSEQIDILAGLYLMLATSNAHDRKIKKVTKKIGYVLTIYIFNPFKL